VAHTVKAHGIPSLENKAASHHSPLSDEDYNAVMSDIMGGKYD
jgi:transketolase